MARLDQPLNAERILRTLADHDVDYVLIGGLAVQTHSAQIHGRVRANAVIELTPAPDPANLERWRRSCGPSTRVF